MTNDLAAAIRDFHENHPPTPFVPAHAQRGELAVAVSPEGPARRVVLVTSVDESRIGHILLASNMTDQATDLDLVVPSEESGAPYDLMVQAELYGPVFVEQLDKLVGHCSAEATAAVAAALDSDGESLEHLPTGLPLGGLDDPRRRFKESELLELQQVVSACRRWLMGDVAEFISIHPAELFPPSAGATADEVFDQLEKVLDILASFEASQRPLPWELVALMDDSARAEIRRWHREHGVDIWTRLQMIATRTDVQLAGAVGVEGLTDALLEAHMEAGTRTLDFVVASGATDVRVIEDTETRTKVLRLRVRTLEEVA